jgi:hypothetical protein
MADGIKALPRRNLYNESADEPLAALKVTIGGWSA